MSVVEPRALPLPRRLADGRSRLLLGAFCIAAVLVGGALVLAILSEREATIDADWVDHTQEVIQRVRLLVASMKEASGDARRYVLTGAPTDLARFHQEAAAVAPQADELARLVSDNPAQRARVERLGGAIAKRLGLLSEGTARRATGSLEELREIVVFVEATPLVEEIRRLAQEIDQTESALLKQREEASERSRKRTTDFIVVGSAIALLLVGLALAALQRDMTARAAAEDELRRQHALVEANVAELERRSAEVRILSEMMTFLHASLESAEVTQVLERLLPTLFPATSGSVYIFRASRNLLERSASWPPGAPTDGDALAPDECWALRRGRYLHEPGSGPTCPHAEAEDGARLCVPMAAAGETIGLLTLRSGSDAIAPGVVRLADAAAAQIALAVSNLQLRQTLRTQSIRDPLTGLYNRRYLEEALGREIARATREKRGVGVIMLDLDHFKRLNDAEGHLVGDAVLRELGILLSGAVRGSDIACRFGGEEFTLVLPGADSDATAKKAESLRVAVERLTVSHRGQSIGALTASLGVASFPKNALGTEEILRRADEALYRAKGTGRNCVCVSENEASLFDPRRRSGTMPSAGKPAPK
jgi:diguanylate cyclase (GGDEF)-like protein